MLHHADDQTFNQEVRQTPGAVLVEFFTPTCAACRRLEPHLKQVAKDFDGVLKVVKVNSEQAWRTARSYGVHMAPTVILFKDGVPLQTISGNPGPRRLRVLAQHFL